MKLRNYQSAAVQKLIENKKFILADDMGLGKTATAINTVASLSAYPCLVVCPASVKYNWAREIYNWTGDSSIVLGGRTVYPVCASNFYIINYDVLDAWADRLQEIGFKYVVFDECHYIRNYNKRTRASVSIARKCDRVALLSGTPVINGSQDLYSYFKIVAPAMFKNKDEFCYKFCRQRLNPWTHRLEYYGSKNDAELNKILHQFILRRRKEDVLDELPAKNRIPIYVDCKSKEYAINFDDEGNVEMQLSRVMSALAADKLPFVYQFVDDFISTGNKILIGVRHIKIADALILHFGNRAVLINGSVSPAARQVAVDRFNNDKTCQVLVGNLQAAGEGINLQKNCSTVAFVELPFTASNLLQFEDRVYRLGQTSNVNIYFFVAENTVDEVLKNILVTKANRVDKIVEDSKSDTLRDLVSILKGSRV